MLKVVTDRTELILKFVLLISGLLLAAALLTNKSDLPPVEPKPTPTIEPKDNNAKTNG